MFKAKGVAVLTFLFELAAQSKIARQQPRTQAPALKSASLALAIANFASLNDVIFADYLSSPIAEPLADKCYGI